MVRKGKRVAKLLHNVTLEVFVKAHDAITTADRALNTLVPVKMDEVRRAQWFWHPRKKKTRVYPLPKRGVRVEESETMGEEGELTVVSYRFSKQRDTQAFVERLHNLAPEEREELERNLTRHLDGEGRLFFRLNREALQTGTLTFRKGPSVMVRLTLAAYPKNAVTLERVARQVVEGCS